MELRMYKYRLYPSSKQKIKIINNFKLCKEAYNTLLDLNNKIYTSNKFDFNSLILDMKICNSDFSNVHSQVLQNVSDRIHKAFDNFFRRVKENSRRKGFPRFKSMVNSITYPQSGFKFISKGHLQVSKIGNLPIILHRIPKGKIKTLTIKQNKAGQWFATFACEVETPSVNHISSEKIGLDIGLENFATLSNGERIENPHFLVKAEEKLKILQRRVSRKVKGSSNRRKARFRLAKQHLKVANQRSDFLHKLSRILTIKYGVIAVEDLNVKGMVRNHHLAKHISDASWSTFIRNLEYKAVTSGSKLVKVNARNTSKTCSRCGEIMDMPLSKRTFQCLNCGFACHRDENASINILNSTVGLTETYTPVDIEPLQQISSVACLVSEAGTIYGK